MRKRIVSGLNVDGRVSVWCVRVREVDAVDEIRERLTSSHIHSCATNSHAQVGWGQSICVASLLTSFRASNNIEVAWREL
jgi:hypothetical protein